jgi:hypothetical protein
LFKKLVTSFAGVCVLAFQAGNVWASTHAHKAVKRAVATVTTTVMGPEISCKKWGPIVIALKIKKTTTLVAGKKVVKIKILDVTTPTYPDHTPKSVYINAQALPLLKGEVLQLQNGNLEVVSGATDTTVSYKQSLQAALLLAKKP